MVADSGSDALYRWIARTADQVAQSQRKLIVGHIPYFSKVSKDKTSSGGT